MVADSGEKQPPAQRDEKEDVSDRAPVKPEVPAINIDVMRTLSEFSSVLRRTGDDVLKTFSTPNLDIFDGDKKLTGDKADKPAGVGERKQIKPNDTLSAGDLRKLSDDAFKTPEQQKAFKDHVDQFEKRAESEKIPASEREKFYAQVARMLQNAQDGGNKRFTADEMRGLALDTMKQGALPGSVNQGNYPTCSVAALESALYKQEPSTIARVVADVSITGSYKTVDGTQITPPERNLRPDKYNDDTPDKKRSGASQIAQNTLLNVHWNRQEGFEGDEKGKKGKIFYEEGHPKDSIGDAQVRLIDRTTGKPYTRTEGFVDPTTEHTGQVHGTRERPLDTPSMSIGKVNDVYKQLVGNHGKMGFVSSFENPMSQSPKTLEEFKKVFDDVASGGKLANPIILGVHANVDPFKADMTRPGASKEEQERMGRMHAYHAVAVFDYDPKTGMATVENQWGQDVDHTGKPGSKERIHINDLYKAYKGEEAGERKTAPEQKRPSGDDYIESQTKFVKELAADKDVAPEKMLEERLTLQKYLQHWKGDEAAKAMLPDIAKDVKNVLSSGKGTYEQMYSDVTFRLPDMMKAGMQKDVREILAGLDKKFVEHMKEHHGFGGDEAIAKMVKLHKEAGNPAAGAALAESYAKLLEGGRTAGGGDAYKWRSASDSAMKKFKELGLDRQAETVYGGLKRELTAAEKSKGSDHEQVIDMKLAMLRSSQAEAVGDKELQGKLLKELEQTFDRVKDGGGVRERTMDDLACTLRDHYADTKQNAKLDKTITSIVGGIAKEYGAKGMDDPRMVGPLALHGSFYLNAGMTDKGLAMLEKAYALAKASNGREFNEVGEKVAALYKQLNRTADAERVTGELQQRRRRRRDE